MRLFTLSVFFVVLAASLYSQGGRGTLTGTVSDPTGAVVPGAPIQAKNVETGAVYDATTSTTGNYTFSQLPVGTYEVVVSVAGFKKYTRNSLAVEVAGAITETNAEYRDGARVTLMEVDMNKLLADPAKFKELAKASPQTLQEAKALLKGIDGVKVEAAPEVRIKFQ